MNQEQVQKYFDLLVRPVITEKSTRARENGCITFIVKKHATKPLIKKAVEAIFGTEVAKVNTINIRGESKIIRGKKGFISGYKKAVVKLLKPEAIEQIVGS